jgi:thiosulfate reductase/polysulfide reductase chain A
MSAKLDTAISRRSFLKWTGAATAATAVGARTPVLHALVPSEENTASGKVEQHFSVCDMCLNKCGLIARVEKGVVTKLDLASPSCMTQTGSSIPSCVKERGERASGSA